MCGRRCAAGQVCAFIVNSILKACQEAKHRYNKEHSSTALDRAAVDLQAPLVYQTAESIAGGSARAQRPFNDPYKPGLPLCRAVGEQRRVTYFCARVCALLMMLTQLGACC